MTDGPSRHEVAAGLVAARSDERILEVGCGHGVATVLLAASALRGSVVAVDRSASMVAATERAARRSGVDDRVTVVHGQLPGTDLLALGPFDAAVAINARIVVDDPEVLASVVAALRPGGRLVHVLEPPSPGRVDALSRRARRALERSGLVVDDRSCASRVAIVASLPPGS